MRHTPTTLAAVLLFTLAATASAQWLNYPTPGVPRTADGKPNLAAPAPHTADGKPDLSGTWDVVHNRPCPPDGCPDMVVPQEFVNIGWALKDGLPYTPWARDLVKSRMVLNGMDDPGSHCMPTGIVKMHTTPLFKKIVQNPGLILILNENASMYRQIFTDGRPLPVDPNPAAKGYSTAHWDGDTLVVDSAGFQDGTWLDRNGSPLTSGGKITERIRRPSYGKLEVQLTIDDPKAYTKPWTVTLNQNLVLDTDLLDYFCVENEKDGSHLVGK